MPSPPLLLHAGTHKTGTTAIQWALASDRERLQAAGINYANLFPEFAASPDQSAVAHHQIAHKLAERDLRARITLYKFRRRLERTARTGAWTILSAEPIYRHTNRSGLIPSDSEWMTEHEKYLRRVKSFLGRFDTTALLYFREPHAFAESLFKESVTVYTGHPHQAFGHFVASRAPHFDYQPRLEVFKRVFGKVQIRQYEAACSKGLLKAFYDDLHLDPPDLQEDQVRRSVPTKGALWLQSQSGDGDRNDHDARVLYALRDPDSLFQTPGKTTLWHDHAVAEGLVNRFARSLELPVMKGLTRPNAPTASWTSENTHWANQAFKDWRYDNSNVLEKRAALGLKHYHPDPQM